MLDDRFAVAGMTIVLPKGRRGHADDIAAAVAWLAGPVGRFTTGQTIHVNGGTYLNP